MAYRITEAHLKAKVEWLNKMTGNPTDPYARDDSGHLKANIGNYHISHACGGVCLHQMASEGGGVRDIFNCGHITKRDLAERISAYMLGIEHGK